MKMGRAMLGATDPAHAAPGTIRGDLGVDVGRNICHGSDSAESAQVHLYAVATTLAYAWRTLTFAVSLFVTFHLTTYLLQVCVRIIMPMSVGVPEYV